MPTNKRTHTSKKPSSQLIKVCLLVSAILTSYFAYHTFVLVQDLKQNLQGAPASYALLPAAILAIFVFRAPSSYKAKYVAVSILSILAFGLLVWLFGVTAAGSSLRTSF